MCEFEMVIGLEVHVELATKTKIFCACSTKFGGKINSHTCPVCTGMPGSLPVLNKRVVELAILVGLATNCKINQYSKFDRKNYFYPDNPQNYQISQLYFPICYEGFIEIGEEVKKKIGIHEIHMEEDAAKLIHDENGTFTLVDYNRSGVPLIEVVSEPDMRSADEVIEYLEKLRLIIQYLKASDCKLQEGSMRVDVNLSVRRVGDLEYGTRTEMKNLNSFRAIRRAIEDEYNRQIKIIKNGGVVLQETRRWDDNKGCSYTMRTKEDVNDYRYFPEPDLCPLKISDEWIKDIRESMPELRDEKVERFRTNYHLSDSEIDLLTQDYHLADFFEATIKCGASEREASNWLLGECMRLLKERELPVSKIPFSPINLAKLIKMVSNDEINRTVAKEVFEEIFSKDIEPLEYAKANNLMMTSNKEKIYEVIREVLCNNPKSIEDFLAGRDRAKGFLVGQAMKILGKGANPKEVNEMISEELDKLIN